jgi:L-carnitine CoA-transferase
MAKRVDVPKFGPLQTVKVINASTGTATGFAATMMAEMGADVIWVENPNALDPARGCLEVESDRRNLRSIATDISTAEGKEIFLDLIKDADIVLESFQVGKFAEWGFSDEELWAVNPKLVVIHISPYGQTGVEEYVKAPIMSDIVAQAFGCLTFINGYEDRDPIPSQFNNTYYFAASYAIACGIAGILKARECGVGESIDISLYETIFRPTAQKVVDWLNSGLMPWREGNRNSITTGWGIYPCGDGECIQTLFLGGTVMKNVLPLLGLEFGSEEYPANQINADIRTPAGKKMEKALLEFCAKRTAAQATAEFMAAGAPASLVMTYAKAKENPQYIARETVTSWENVEGDTVKGPNVFPQFARNTGKIWRGCPAVGMDSDDILAELGRTPEEIAALKESGAVIG